MLIFICGCGEILPSILTALDVRKFAKFFKKWLCDSFLMHLLGIFVCKIFSILPRHYNVLKTKERNHKSLHRCWSYLLHYWPPPCIPEKVSKVTTYRITNIQLYGQSQWLLNLKKTEKRMHRRPRRVCECQWCTYMSREA
jgi:hypothetical protein